MERELRIAMIGQVNSGKSTVTGVLTRGILDDGRGLSRSYVLRHDHERKKGQSSSPGFISQKSKNLKITFSNLLS